MNKLVPIALLTLLPLASAVSAETENDRWNLADLYPSVEAWNADYAKVDAQLKEFGACKGKLASSVARFKSCLDLQYDIIKRYYRVSGYSSKVYDENTGGTAGLELNQRAGLLGSRVGQAMSFVSPEVLKMGAAKVEQFIKQDKSLAVYRQPLKEILRAAPHTLTTDGEAIVADMAQATGAASNVYSIFSNADMPWPQVTLSDGSKVTLDQSAYTKYRAVNNREDRKLVFDAFWGKWKSFERTFGVIFYEKMKRDTVYSKLRKYPSTLEQALDSNNVPVAVYDQLVAQVNASLPTLHRYFKLRAKMLGVSEMRYYDIYPPLVTSDLKYPVEQAKSLTLEAVKPLGPDYAAAMSTGFKNRWMDTYPRKSKRSGAYMSGSAYDVHPYVLMNYNDDYESVSTLAHEWGHALHSYMSNKKQPFATANYPIFTAEIASTTNEVLLLDHMLKIAKTDDERLLYLGSALENMRGTFYRQTMFAEFERAIHAKVDKGESLTGAGVTKIYGDILKRYHGDAEGVVKIDDLYTVEWAFIPHFYNRFYVFQYATSVSAGTMFAEEILNGDPKARERYLDVLRAGGSDYAYDLVKNAGVDLATPAPYQAVVKRMNMIMDEIEAIYARRAKK
ncbi:MAG TPA: oligoendopeptidase F [Burkholderiaceae bacterium]